MRRRVAIPAFVGVALGLCIFAGRATSIPSGSLTEINPKSPAVSAAAVVESGNRFAFDLYERLRSADGNLFFSPASVSVALAMGYAGAAENTAAEMAKTLHLAMPKDQVNEEMRALLASWKVTDKKQGFRLDVANRLWGQEAYKFLAQYLQVTRDDYGAELARLDFRQPEAARQAINHWVEEQTQDKIKNLIASPDAIKDARLVLTNAVYFKGEWQEQFKKYLTKDDEFHVSATRAIKAPLMRQEHGFRYLAANDLQLLELPYGNGSLSMVVLLPQKVDGLPQLEAKLSTTNLGKWLGDAKSEDVIVFLPKFKTTATFELTRTLKSMGMASAFNPVSADFSGMTGERDLYISSVIHKAFVDVNEEGTEAAAATAIIMAPTAVIVRPKAPPVFRADHPFVFLIRDNRNGAILFLGRITDPTK
jgi:serpin B